MGGQTYRCQPARLSTSRLPDPGFLALAQLCRTAIWDSAKQRRQEQQDERRIDRFLWTAWGLAEAGDLRTTHGNADEPGFGGPEEVTWGARARRQASNVAGHVINFHAHFSVLLYALLRIASRPEETL